jgi:hypothetical protein
VDGAKMSVVAKIEGAASENIEGRTVMTGAVRSRPDGDAGKGTSTQVEGVRSRRLRDAQRQAAGCVASKRDVVVGELVAERPRAHRGGRRGCSKLAAVLVKLCSVFGCGMLGLWASVPLGFVLRLPPVLVGAVSALGSTTAALIVLVLGEGLRARLVRPGGRSEVRKDRLIDRVWQSYGIVGFALLAPGLLGAPLGVATGLVLGAPARRLLPWLLVGISLWTLALTVLGAYGSAGLRALGTG